MKSSLYHSSGQTSWFLNSVVICTASFSQDLSAKVQAISQNVINSFANDSNAPVGGGISAGTCL